MRSIDTYHIDPYLSLLKPSESKQRFVVNDHKKRKTKSKYVDDKRIVINEPVNVMESEENKIDRKIEEHENPTAPKIQIIDTVQNEDRVLPIKAPASILLSLQHQVKSMNLKLIEKEPKTIKSKLTLPNRSFPLATDKNYNMQSPNDKSPCKHISTYNREEAREFIKKQQARRKSEMANKTNDQTEIIKNRLDALKQTQRDLVRVNVQKKNKKRIEQPVRQASSKNMKGKNKQTDKKLESLHVLLRVNEARLSLF